MSNKLSGQTTVTASGTAVALGSGIVNGPLQVSALPTNTHSVYIGNDGNDTVSNLTGFVIPSGESLVFNYVGDLGKIYVNSLAANQKVSYIILDQSKTI